MTNKFVIKSILAVSSVFVLSVMSPTANALVSSTTVSGCSLYKKSLGQCSVFVDGILKGLGNVGKNPTAFAVTMTKISGTIFCKNPAGNSTEANGVPFTNVEVLLSDVDPLEQAQVTKNGKALSEIVFHDPQIIEAIKTATQVPDCQHSNWLQVIVVTQMEVIGQQLEGSDPSVITDTLRTSCRIQDPYFLNPASAIGVKSYDYNCTEICHSTDSSACNLTTP